MAAKYQSIEYNLNVMGISDLKSAIISSDMDSGVSIEVSFDGGSTFVVYETNKKIDIIGTTGKIVVRVLFNSKIHSEYLITISGNYQMLTIGTSLYFREDKSGKIYQTAIGVDGSYKISIPPGIYTIYYYDSRKNEIILGSTYSPTLYINNAEPSAKINTVEMFIRDIPWVKYGIFDIFENLEKMDFGTATLDINGDLHDVDSNTVCRWWAIGLE